MFLATTSLDEFWDTSEKILFAGEWCKLYDNRQRNDSLDSETFPYQWDPSSPLSDREDAIRTIHTTYNKTLESLTTLLNVYLGIEESTRYYGTILGLWLMRFIHSSVDKFFLFEQIIKKYDHKNIRTIVLSEKQFFVPSHDFKPWNSSWDYSHLMEFSRLAKFFKLTHTEKNAKNPPHQESIFISKKSLKVGLLHSFLNLFQTPEICITGPYLRHWTSYLKLWRKSRRLLFNDFNYDLHIKIQMDSNFRKQYLLNDAHTPFEHYISKNILSFIPLIFIEGHNNMRAAIEDLNIKKSDIYYNAIGIQDNIIYKFFIASELRYGKKLLTHQHGAGYGVDIESCDEIYERSISDLFLTFGWEDGLGSKYLPVEKLNSGKHNPKAPNVLLVLTGTPRYIHRLFDLPKSIAYINWTVDMVAIFLNLLGDTSINLRFYPVDFGWSVKQRMCEKTTYFTESTEPFLDAFNKAKLVILEHLGTTLYTAIASNKPVIAFVSRETYLHRESAQPLFDQLHAVGILHYSPDAAAIHYTHIKDNIDRWWLSTEVQKARNEFARHLARPSQNWAQEFTERLEGILKNDY